MNTLRRKKDQSKTKIERGSSWKKESMNLEILLTMSEYILLGWKM